MMPAHVIALKATSIWQGKAIDLIKFNNLATCIGVSDEHIECVQQVLLAEMLQGLFVVALVDALQDLQHHLGAVQVGGAQPLYKAVQHWLVVELDNGLELAARLICFLPSQHFRQLSAEIR